MSTYEILPSLAEGIPRRDGEDALQRRSAGDAVRQREDARQGQGREPRARLSSGQRFRVRLQCRRHSDDIEGMIERRRNLALSVILAHFDIFCTKLIHDSLTRIV